MRTIRRGLSLAFVLSTLAVAAGPAPQAHAACTPPQAAPTGLIDTPPTGFVPIAPTRIADTRLGIGVTKAPIEAGCVLRVPIATADPPADATAAAITVTSTGATKAGFVTAYGCGSSLPATSSLNPRPGDPTPNLAIVALDSTRELCFYSEQQTELIVDVTGWFTPSGARFHEIAPIRAFDSRANLGPDGAAAPLVAAGTTVRIRLAGAQVPSVARAVAITLTITKSSAPTYATAFPCTATPPPTSTTNVLRNRDRGAPALVGLDSSGDLCVFTEQPAHLVVDVAGWFGPDTSTDAATATIGSPLETLATSRLADSRHGIGWATGRFIAGETRRLTVLDTAPVGTTSVQLNLTVTDSTQPGYLTAWPCDTPRPEVSAVNYLARATETAVVTVGVGPLGDVCIYASGVTHVIADLLAGYGTPGSFHALLTSPVLDQTYRAGQLDHTLHCPSGGGSVTLALDPAPGVLTSLNGAAPVTGRRVVTVPMVADQAAVVRLSGKVTEEHWIRCLPTDFPRLTPTGVSPTPGWYVTSTLNATPYAMILDEFGVPVWYKRTSQPVIGVWPAANSRLTWRRWTGGGFPGGAGQGPENPPLGFDTYQLDGTKVSTVGPVGGTQPLDWHEILDLPGGGHLVVVYETRNTATSRPCTTTTGASITTTQVTDSLLIELDVNGAEVWNWNSKDHTEFNPDSKSEVKLPVCFQVAPSGTDNQKWALDYMHVNSVQRLDDGDYVVAARHFNSISRIDRAPLGINSKFVWKLGGSAPKVGEGILLTLLDVNGQPAGAGVALIGPHDARVLSNGNVTVHDNHLGSAPRASEFAIDLTAGTARLVWQKLSTNPQGSTLGSVRRQPDGSTVIGWGEGTNPWLEEIDSAGTSVLKVATDPGLLSYRVVKVPAADFDRATLRALAGGSITVS